MKVPQTPPLTLSEQFTATPDSEAAGGVVQPSLSIFLAFLPEVTAQSLWGDLFAFLDKLFTMAVRRGPSMVVAPAPPRWLHRWRSPLVCPP